MVKNLNLHNFFSKRSSLILKKYLKFHITLRSKHRKLYISEDRMTNNKN